MKAHFLRLVHPINYFLVPKRSNETDIINNDIGEYIKLLQYMYLYTKDKYEDIFESYQKNILFNYSYNNIILNNIKNEKINIKYGIKTKIITTGPKIFQAYNEIDLIRAYLKDGLSYRSIEIEIMGMDSPVRGGGFVAMKILHNLGIEGENKGVLKYKTVDNEIENAKGEYRTTLIKYKNLL
jgi:hypothetical protein